MNESSNDFFLKEYKYIFKKYKPIKKIGEGCFGNIYSVIRLKDKSIFAMKTEKINTKDKMLESEAYILYNLQKGLGIPKLITYGRNKNYNILIETLLGKSLENIFIKRQLKCNIVDVCAVGIQIIDRLEWIHSNNIIYRDIKPENFLVGINDPNVIYVIDFGLCKKYRSSKTGKHILPKADSKFCGNLKFSSSNTTRGKESSRRDDIISLGYMLIYLIKKGLPWDYTYKTKITSSKLFELIYLKETNCFGNLFDGLPSEFNEFIKYSQNLKFEEDPNYSYLRSILSTIILNNIFIKGIYNFSYINNADLYSSKSHSRKKTSLHRRMIESLERKRNNSEKNKDISLFNAINNSNEANSLLNFESKNFYYQNSNTFNSSLYKFRTLNTSKEEKNIAKKENSKIKIIFPNHLKYKNIQKNLRSNTNTLNNCSINTTEINKSKIKPNSVLKDKISLINKQKSKIILKNYWANSYSINSTSNNIISVRTHRPQKKLAVPINLLYNKKRQNNNKIKRRQILNFEN